MSAGHVVSYECICMHMKPHARWFRDGIMAKPGALTIGMAVQKIQGPLGVVNCLGDGVGSPFRRPDLQSVCSD